MGQCCTIFFEFKIRLFQPKYYCVFLFDFGKSAEKSILWVVLLIEGLIKVQELSGSITLAKIEYDDRFLDIGSSSYKGYEFFKIFLLFIKMSRREFVHYLIKMFFWDWNLNTFYLSYTLYFIISIYY